MKIKELFEERAAVVLAEETFDGMIVPAPTSEKMHIISKVVAVGAKSKLVKVDDIVQWQWNSVVGAHCRYDVGGERLFVLYEKDLIAKLSSTKISLDTFQIIGDWRLVERIAEDAPPSRIIVPSAVADTALQHSMHHRLVQTGVEDPLRPCKVGDILLVERHRANPLRIGGKDYYYLQSASILGIVE